MKDKLLKLKELLKSIKFKKEFILHGVIGVLCVHFIYFNIYINSLASKTDLHFNSVANYESRLEHIEEIQHVLRLNQEWNQDIINTLEIRCRSLSKAVANLADMCDKSFSCAAEAYRKASLTKQSCLNEIEIFVKSCNNSKEDFNRELLLFYYQKPGELITEEKVALFDKENQHLLFETYDNGRVRCKQQPKKQKNFFEQFGGFADSQQAPQQPKK